MFSYPGNKPLLCQLHAEEFGEYTLARALLAMLRSDVHDHVEWPLHLEEFIYLVEAAGFEVIETVLQTRMRQHGGFLFGRGKVDEIAQIVAMEDIETVAVYNVLTSMQKFNLQRVIGVPVLDRYEIVLQVFGREARDNISQLQLELAALQKSYPYIKVTESERLLHERPARRGGRGPGEYAYHAQLRQLRKRIAKVTSELTRYRGEHRRRMRKRRQMGVPMVCIVGCYNAGKTSLFNALTGAEKEVSARPFTTLASKWSLAGNPGLFFVDTIGFALDLDPELISAFQLNLDDMRAADVLLLVVDISDAIQLLGMKIESSLEILRATGIDEARILVVLNKTDLVDSEEAEEATAFIKEAYKLPSVSVSAETEGNFEELMTKIRVIYEMVRGASSSPRQE
ncbi:MAG: GTPase HflX [Promethearchaeota archaeon]